ncbi:glycosyltransferase, partial [Sulfurihydrogenibium sp.]|uniref:glycosyltransferase n=1 Tax=Sulfurihydrogenibium sp. TaxID=2053621 RepID=UPI00262582DE
MKSLVVLPTYNEAENIDKILERLTKYDFLDILVVDDNSVDGTREKVYKWIENNPKIYILER